MGRRVEKRKLIESEKDTYKVVTFDDLINNLDEYVFIIIDIFDSEINILENIVELEYTSINTPFVISEQMKTLFINKEYFINNYDKVLELLCFIVKNIKSKRIELVKKCLINETILKSIVSNANIEEVYLAPLDNFIISDEVYTLFKNTHIKSICAKDVSENLQNIFDPILRNNMSRVVFSGYKYRQLLSLEMCSINRNLTDQEINNLELLVDLPIKIGIHLDKVDNDNLVKIINKLISLNIQNEIVMERLNGYRKHLFNEFFFNNLDLFNKLNITFSKIGYYSSLKNYIINEKFLYSFVKELNNSDLSPFEKFMYIYNAVKQYKKYKENKDSLLDSRELYEVLYNEYMVCVGFSVLLIDLLGKVGICACYRGVTVNDFVLDKDEGHARVYVHIVDPKYNIDGFYVSDPTWDNDLQCDYYNYAVMTDEECNDHREYLYMEEKNELFNVNNYQEFFDKLNLFINRKNPKSRNKYLYNYVNEIIRCIRELDLDFYNELVNLYPNIKIDINMISEDELNSIITELGYYLGEKCNNVVSGKNILLAASEARVFENKGKIDKEIMYNFLKMVNTKRHESTFPKRYKTNANGRRTIIANAKNKFKDDNLTKK